MGSQPWMPGPAIPEDDDEEAGGMGSWLTSALELPARALDNSSAADHTPSYWASYAPTPITQWPETPSEVSPVQTPRRNSAPFGNLAANTNFPYVTQGVIPMYVTVPLAMAHTCP